MGTQRGTYTPSPRSVRRAKRRGKSARDPGGYLVEAPPAVFPLQGNLCVGRAGLEGQVGVGVCLHQEAGLLGLPGR